MIKLKHIYYNILVLAALCMVTACEDRFPNPDVVIGEGESLVEATVSFEPFGETELASRTAGDALQSISKLYILRYNPEEELLSCDEITDFIVSHDNNNRPSNEVDGTVSAETNTDRATFNMKIPYGRYHIYAVANIDIPNEWGDEANYNTVEKLLNQSVEWNSDDVSKNRQMLGHFTMDNTAGGHRSTQCVIVNNPNTHLKAWVKRVASKVTVAFDTRQLKENVFIYLKSVAIRDIPKAAYIGRDNVPGEKVREISSELLDGEALYFGNADATHQFSQAAAHHNKWKQIANGDSIFGYHSQTSGAPDRNVYNTYAKRLSYEHEETTGALYFFENMQGNGKSKLQDANQDNTIDFPEPDKDKPGTGWKDEKPYGTYVEVEGYYVSQDTLRPGRGAIKYRFMMGKDVLNDYNAERNRHYKLTLQFKGYANDYDWHIDYDEEAKPGTIAPDTAYVSYYYNQTHTYVIRSTPRPGYKLVAVDAVILKNEWRPDNAEGVDQNGYTIYNKKTWQDQISEDYYHQTVIGSKGPFVLNKSPRFDTDPNDPDHKINDPNCEYGFLSLRNVSTVSLDFDEGGGTQQGVENLIDNAQRAYFDVYTNNGANGKRTLEGFPQEQTSPNGQLCGDAVDGFYSVHLDINPRSKERNYVVSVPIYTRAKSIGWRWAVYSGANPYYEHQRKAYVRTVMRFVSLDPAQAEKYPSYQDTCYTTVIQEPRIDNPRAIFRKHNSLEPFNVTLKTTLLFPQGDKCYENVISHGEWSAEIECDPYGLVRLSKGSQIATGEGNKIKGRTGTDVSFTYTPNRVVGENQAIGAIITVRYHNNQCIHKIIVRQGYGPVQFAHKGLKWLSFNVYDDNSLTKSPLSIGSFFRYNGNTRYPIAEENNYRTDNANFGLGANPGNAAYILNTTNTSRVWTWDNIYRADSPDGVNPRENFRNNNLLTRNGYRLPTADEVESDLLTNNDLQITMGIAYGDGARNTLDTSDAYSFSDTKNTGNPSAKGVRGALVYCLEHGDNLFFPLGALGHGRRTAHEYYADNGNMYGRNVNGLLAYGDVTSRLGGRNTAADAGKTGNVYNLTVNNYRPFVYRMPDQPGAIYWLARDYDFPAYLGLDINYSNYQVDKMPTDNLFRKNGSVYLGSDALPIRPVLVN